MTQHSDDALALAGDICTAHIYPVIADLIATAQQYCEWDSCPLTDSQIEQLTRASICVCDGINDRITQAIDTRRRVLGILGEMSDAS